MAVQFMGNDRLGVALLFLAALVLRLYGIGDEALWADEFYTLHTIRPDGLGSLFSRVAENNPHPPLYFLIVSFFRGAFGEGETVLRLPSALAGAATVPLFYILARRLFPKRMAALVAGGLLAVSPFHIWYSQEARPYALQVLLLVAGALGLALWMDGADRAAWKRKAGAALAGLFLLAGAVHYFSLLLFPFFAGILVWGVSTKRLDLKPAAAALAGAFLLGALLAWSAWAKLSQAEGISWIGETAWKTLPLDILQAQFLGPFYTPLPRLLFFCGLVLAAILIGHGGVALWRNHRRLFYTLSGGLILLICIPAAVSLFRPVLHQGQRYLIIALPFFLLIAAGALASRTRPARLVAWALIGLLAMFQIAYLAHYYTARQKRTWDTAAEVVERNAASGEPIYVAPARLAGLMEYYLGDQFDVSSGPPGEPHGTFVLVALNDPRQRLREQGLDNDRLAAAILEASRPGQEIWIVRVTAAPEVSASPW